MNLRLRDETLAHMDSGIAMQSEFNVKPWSFAVICALHREPTPKRASAIRSGTLVQVLLPFV